MKKALQLRGIGAHRILPDGAAVGRPRKACCSRLCNKFAQILVLDLRGQSGTPLALLRRRVDRLSRGLFGLRRAQVGKLAREETQAGRRRLLEALPQPLEDLSLELRQLERPGRGRGRDVEGSVA